MTENVPGRRGVWLSVEHDFPELPEVISAWRRQKAEFRNQWRRRTGIPEKNRGDERLRVAGDETRRIYVERGRKLLERFRREAGYVSIEDLDPRSFVDWMLGAVYPFVSPSTWRGYRADGLALILSVPSDHLSTAAAMLFSDVEEEVRDGQSARIEKAHFDEMRDSIKRVSKSRMGDYLHDMWVASVATGLRSSEWALADLNNEELHVISVASHELGWSHRTLDVAELTSNASSAVAKTVEISREWLLSGKLVARQAEVSRLLKRVAELVFPRRRFRYDLQTLRYQFIANMRTIYNREEVAAMIGHISLDFEIAHYANRRAGWLAEDITEKPKPIVAQVARMRRRFQYRDLYTGIRGIARGGRDISDRGR
jgi:hypothetical protein